MIELLSPAGGMPQLRAALRFGADAVYGGLNAYGLRAFAGNFTWDSLLNALKQTHDMGKKFYLTLNILPYDDELDGLLDAAEHAQSMGVDAVIVSDLGAALLLRERVPALPLHISTQANTLNAASASFWANLGAQRVVLARELSLERIKHINAHTPATLAMEVFVHGAMCMSYSGRCMLSDHMTGRGGNHGACAQPCRYEYTVVEQKRPTQQLKIHVDEHGTGIFSAYDLCMLEHLPALIDTGVASLKIEGRMKNAFYVATVTRAYRAALDLLQNEGEDAYVKALPALKKELKSASHRAFNTGFYFGAPTPAAGAKAPTQEKEYIADVMGCAAGNVRLRLKNRFFVGDALEALTPHGVFSFEASQIIDAMTGEACPTVSIAGKEYLVSCPYALEEGDIVRGVNRNHQ